MQAQAGINHVRPRVPRWCSELELFSRWSLTADGSAREELVRRYLPLAHKLAQRYARSQEPLEDLLQVASLGLIKAIDRFDPERGVRFASFAVPTILGELRRHFRDKGRGVYLPRSMQELMLKVRAAQTRLEGQTGRSPTVVDLARDLDLDIETVLEGLEAMVAQQLRSLDVPMDAGDEDGRVTRHELVGREDDQRQIAARIGV